MTVNHLVIVEYLILFFCGLPIMLLLGMIMFGSWKGLFEALRFLVVPDIVSLLRGEYFEDQLATIKLIAFVLFYAGGLFVAHRLYFPN